jgi:hypothetical protein
LVPFLYDGAQTAIFYFEEYTGREGGIELPEIQASLRLDELYDGISLV